MLFILKDVDLVDTTLYNKHVVYNFILQFIHTLCTLSTYHTWSKASKNLGMIKLTSDHIILNKVSWSSYQLIIITIIASQGFPHLSQNVQSLPKFTMNTLYTIN